MKDHACDRTRQQKARNNPKKFKIIHCINDGEIQNPLRRRWVQKPKQKNQEVLMCGRNENQRSKSETLLENAKGKLECKVQKVKGTEDT